VQERVQRHATEPIEKQFSDGRANMFILRAGDNRRRGYISRNLWGKNQMHDLGYFPYDALCGLYWRLFVRLGVSSSLCLVLVAFNFYDTVARTTQRMEGTIDHDISLDPVVVLITPFPLVHENRGGRPAVLGAFGIGDSCVYGCG